ncbi:hypothetical protein LCGC14_0535230 [marine sediment metagenome]|uniref:Methyltransferase FkbM domain-containing protein n=1 Tax=marine sediment metagenome TaxID=412755 RepID=A0A0F9RUK4_9ZZZZ
MTLKDIILNKTGLKDWYHTKRMETGFLYREIENVVKKGHVFVDVGSHIGVYTKLASKLAGPKGIVHSFEPLPSNYNKLLKNVGGRINVKTYNNAVADFNGEKRFYESAKSNLDNSFYEGSEDRNIPHIVQVVTLDSVLKHADVIKIDVEGAEHLVLKGMKNILKNENVIIFIEYLKKWGNPDPQFLEILFENEFIVKPIYTESTFGNFMADLICQRGI